jgi:hypothetical protein
MGIGDFWAKALIENGKAADRATNDRRVISMGADMVLRKQEKFHAGKRKDPERRVQGNCRKREAGGVLIKIDRAVTLVML